jgi:hypothetical protein
MFVADLRIYDFAIENQNDVSLFAFLGARYEVGCVFGYGNLEQSTTIYRPIRPLANGIGIADFLRIMRRCNRGYQNQWTRVPSL